MGFNWKKWLYATYLALIGVDIQGSKGQEVGPNIGYLKK